MERRRGARIPARFWVQVSGVDQGPDLRRGDVSLSGAYIEIDREIGPPGTVQAVWIAPHRQEESVQLLARVVRVVSIQDVWHDRPGIAGVAFEFLPEPSKREKLSRIVGHIMTSRSYVAENVAESVAIESGLGVKEEDAGAESCELAVRTMVLETNWLLEVNDPVTCAITTAGRRATFEGRVLHTTEEQRSSAPCFRVEVDFQQAKQTEAGGRSISDAMDSLLEEVVFPEAPAARSLGKLSGSLERIRLGELFAYLEVQGASGVLRVTRENANATVWVHFGRIVDVEAAPGPEDPRDAIILVCSYVSGDFVFSPEPVERTDRIGATIGELLATPV